MSTKIKVFLKTKSVNKSWTTMLHKKANTNCWKNNPKIVEKFGRCWQALCAEDNITKVTSLYMSLEQWFLTGVPRECVRGAISYQISMAYFFMWVARQILI